MMPSLLDGHLLRSDLVHADERLFPSAVVDLHHSTVSIKVHDAEGLTFLLDSLLDPTAAPTTASLVLKPRAYRPEELSPPEFPPSNLLVGVDQKRGAAAVALLAFDRYHQSHQWLPRGNAWRADVAALAMDPANAEDTQFPREAYITVPQLRKVVSGWAWDAELPPAGVQWRRATEREVRWSWF
jgi:hypothetical protein